MSRENGIPRVGEVWVDTDLANATEVLGGKDGDRLRDVSHQRRVSVITEREEVTPGVGVGGWRFTVRNAVTGRVTSITGGAFLPTRGYRSFQRVDR